MSDPRNNNPFTTDSNRVKNERDANRELAKSAREQLPDGVEAWELDDPWGEFRRP